MMLRISCKFGGGGLGRRHHPGRPSQMTSSQVGWTPPFDKEGQGEIFSRAPRVQAMPVRHTAPPHIPPCPPWSPRDLPAAPDRESSMKEPGTPCLLRRALRFLDTFPRSCFGLGLVPDSARGNL